MLAAMDRIRVATLNIWNKSGPWASRREVLRDELRSLSPDVIGFQEVLRLEPRDGQLPSVESDQAREISEGTDYQVAYGPAGDYGNGLRLGNALLSRFRILSQDCFELPGSETDETRSLLYARVETPLGQLPIFVTHLNWKLFHGSVRIRQVRAVVEHIERLAPLADATALPPILMGDFNAEPDADEMRFLRGLCTIDDQSVYFADAWIYGGDGSPGYTFDRKNRFAAIAHEPPRRLDYILVRGPDGKLRGEPLNTRVVFATPRPTPEGDVWPSDHFGVMTEIVIRPQFGTP
jgi:endonuclease/exonuclease/phosphatase family metal-dependent hydrolase